MEVTIYQKHKHSTLITQTVKQTQLPYPYNKITNAIIVEPDAIYIKPLLDLKDNRLLLFDNTTDMIDCLINLHEQYPNLITVNGCVYSDRWGRIEGCEDR